MSKRPTIPQATLDLQAKASDPRLSAWVSANAGSGKTHVLSERVIRLLLHGTEPARILCLTYTKAAAANMANRVFDRLADWTRLGDAELAAEVARIAPDLEVRVTLKRARCLFAQALETPGGLKIQTIHAFCEAVLHQFPLEANIAGHFEMLDPQMEAALLAEARREMIAGAGGGADPALAEAFADVLQRVGESGLDELLSAIVSRRDALRRFIDQTSDHPAAPRFEALFEEFGLDAAASAADIALPYWPLPGLDAAYFAKLRDAAEATSAATMLNSVLPELELAFAEQDPALRILQAARGLLTSKGEPYGDKLGKKALLDRLPDLPERYSLAAEAVMEARDRLALHAMLCATRSALIVADRLIGLYERQKSARGYLDFNDLIVRTVSLLTRKDAAAWVQYKLDKGIDHILIDEAQDTSPDQWAVVKALAADFFAGASARETPRTIFAVGDEKQSIYSFQGADPEAFAGHGIEFSQSVRDAGQEFEKVRLLHSFRSVQDVLSAVDLTFGPQHARKGLTRDPEPLEHKAIREAAPGCVEIWPTLTPQKVEEPDDWTEAIDHASAPAIRLAEMIANTLDHWRRNGEFLEGQGRPLAGGDVLVLVRKRDSFVHALSRELKERGIAVAGADRLELTGHIAVQDLMAIGRVVLQPEDDLSLAALLKSPVFGFSEDELFTIAAGRPAAQSLWRRLAELASRDERWHKAVETLRRWRNEAGFVSPFAFYATILGRDGVRGRMIARLGAEAGDVLDEFLGFCLSAEKLGRPGLEHLLGLLEQGSPEIKREMDQARGEVRIMTAHSAKGLEAPVVFLVDSGGAPFHGSHLPRLVPFSSTKGGWQGDGFLWRASAEENNSFSRAREAAIREKAEEEYRRLLYVGMTRAEDRLIVCGYKGTRPPPAPTWHVLVEQALAASPDCTEVPHPVTEETILRYRVTPPGAVEPPAEPQEARLPAPVPAALSRPLPAAPRLPRPLAPSAAGAAIEPAHDPIKSRLSPVLGDAVTASHALSRGTAVHRLLQRLPAIAPERRAEVAPAFLERLLGDWSPEERADLWQEVAAVLDDARFAAIFSPASRAEVSIAGTVEIGGEARSVTGKIDRLAVEDGRVSIVDFKTNRPAPASLAEVPAAHVAQMALYRALLSEIYPGMDILAALLFTAAPRLVAIPADAMDAALASLAAGAREPA